MASSDGCTMEGRSTEHGAHASYMPLTCSKAHLPSPGELADGWQARSGTWRLRCRWDLYSQSQLQPPLPTKWEHRNDKQASSNES